MKILIASVPNDGGDGVAVQSQVVTYCPTATTSVVHYANMSDAVAYAIANGFNGIARNVSDFASSYAQAAVAKAAGIWISWAHGSNSHVFEAWPDHLVDNAIGVGRGSGGVNANSYGPALDFFVDGAPNESQACGIIAGKTGQMLIDNPTKSFEQIRAAMRQASSNHPTFATDGGYGSVDLSRVQAMITYPIIYSGVELTTELGNLLVTEDGVLMEAQPGYSGYCSQNGDDDGDIAPSKITKAKLVQLTCDEAVDATAVVQSAIDDAIEAADADIDSYAGRKYVVPFRPVPTKVKALSVVLAVYKLHEKRIDVLGGEIPKSIRDMYDDAIAFLKDVAKGVAVIDGAVSPAVNTTRTGGSFTANDRVFGKGSFDQL